MWIESFWAYEDVWNKEQKESLANISLSSLNDTQKEVEHKARNYVMREQKLWLDSQDSISEINTLLEKQEQENKSLEKQIQSETKEFLDKEALINEAKITIYEELGINDNLNENSTFENFSKWLVDELIIWNYEMAVEIINTKWKIIIDALKQLATWEWIKKLAKALWESVLKLFSWNAYEK